MGGGGGLGGQGGCERRIEFFVKIQKKMGGSGSGWGGGGVRVDVNKELKFLRKFKNIFFWGGGGRVGGGRGQVGGGVSGWMWTKN